MPIVLLIINSIRIKPTPSFGSIEYLNASSGCAKINITFFCDLHFRLKGDKSDNEVLHCHRLVVWAAALQDDLRRAHIEPYAWVLNKSVLAAGTHDPLLAARLAGERKQMERMSAGLAPRSFVAPWLSQPPVGIPELAKMVGH